MKIHGLTLRCAGKIEKTHMKTHLFAREKILILAFILVIVPFYLCLLSLKPVHVDESINGFFVNSTWSKGFYQYDPTNYHGPLLFYLFQISEKVFGFGISSFRLVSAVCSIMSILMILFNRSLLGSYAAFLSAIALGLSPGMIYFGRSAIHEPLFVFFQVLCIMAFLAMAEGGGRRSAIWFAAGLTGCMLVKETFVIFALSSLLAWAWISASERLPGNLALKEAPRNIFAGISLRFFITTAGLSLSVLFLFFTGFFHNMNGTGDFFTALIPWMKTGVGGSGHEKPFFYWVGLMSIYEWAGAAGLLLSVPGLFGSTWKLRFFSAMALTNATVYSMIPYKTPWCIITILWPCIVVMGLQVEDFLRRNSRPHMYLIPASVLAAILLVHSGAKAFHLNFRNYENPDEPYVYVQTRDEVKHLIDMIERKVAEFPELKNLSIVIDLKKSAWPLPWVFSRYPNVHYGNYSGLRNADVIFKEITDVPAGMQESHVRYRVRIREAREPVDVYVRKGLL